MRHMKYYPMFEIYLDNRPEITLFVKLIQLELFDDLNVQCNLMNFE